MKKFYVFVLLTLVFSMSMSVFAQAENLQVTYNTVFSHKFNAANEELFAEFSAKKDELVYLQAEYEGVIIGNITLDLRDQSGQSIGTQESYLLENYVIATIPQDGTYIAVITSEEPETVRFEVGLSGYLNDGIDVEITSAGFRKIYMVNVPSDGEYVINYTRTSGALDVNFVVVNMSSMLTEAILDIKGIAATKWSASINLTTSDKYMIFMEEYFFAMGNDGSVQVSITFAPAE